MHPILVLLLNYPDPLHRGLQFLKVLHLRLIVLKRLNEIIDLLLRDWIFPLVLKELIYLL